MEGYRVKNWSEFQHYKDRSPPWIRLHRALLDNYHFHSLPVASRALAPMLWLLASENKDLSSGIVEGSDEKIAFRLRQSVKDLRSALKPLIDSGFIERWHDASASLANDKHNATPETEAETDRTEAETETETETDAGGRTRPTLEELSLNHVGDWLAEKRAKGKYLQHDEQFILDYFKNYCQSKGKPYADYVAAFRNAFEWDACQPDRQRKQASRGKSAARQSAFAEQDYHAGIPDGFDVVGQ